MLKRVLLIRDCFFRGSNRFENAIDDWRLFGDSYAVESDSGTMSYRR